MATMMHRDDAMGSRFQTLWIPIDIFIVQVHQLIANFTYAPTPYAG